jgi:hypothetical protein
MQKTRAWLLVSVMISIPFAGRADNGPPKVLPEGPVWSAGAGFQFAVKANKKRESVSGIACPAVSASPRRCIVAFDEGGEARFAIVDRGRLIPQPERIVLLSGEQELDAEGAARDGDTVYITGSNSPKRSDCKENANSRHVFRFKVDPASGNAKLDRTGEPVDLEDDRGNLWKYLTANKPFDSFTRPGKCLGKPDHAVNIEGLAAADAILYFGFREPAYDQQAYILAVPGDQLFSSSGISAAKSTEITVGSGRGGRDMLAVPEGILLLIGPDDDNGKGIDWRIALWDRSGAKDLKVLADLDLRKLKPKPCPSRDTKDVKPEAMAMIENGNGFRRLLILSDGMCDGGATVFRVPK